MGSVWNYLVTFEGTVCASATFVRRLINIPPFFNYFLLGKWKIHMEFKRL